MTVHTQAKRTGLMAGALVVAGGRSGAPVVVHLLFDPLDLLVSVRLPLKQLESRSEPSPQDARVIVLLTVPDAATGCCERVLCHRSLPEARIGHGRTGGRGDGARADLAKAPFTMCQPSSGRVWRGQATSR